MVVSPYDSIITGFPAPELLQSMHVHRKATSTIAIVRSGVVCFMAVLIS